MIPLAILQTQPGAKPMDEALEKSKRGPGRPRVVGRPVKDGNPKLQGRVDPSLYAWVQARGGWDFVRKALENLKNGDSQ